MSWTPFDVKIPDVNGPLIATFEYVWATGLYIPAFDVLGTKKTFPVGRRTPLLKPDRGVPRPEISENSSVLGLYIPT
jgi:hypothetical protein